MPDQGADTGEQGQLGPHKPELLKKTLESFMCYRIRFAKKEVRTQRGVGRAKPRQTRLIESRNLLSDFSFNCPRAPNRESLDTICDIAKIIDVPTEFFSPPQMTGYSCGEVAHS